MKSHHTFHFSSIEFRHNPADPSGQVIHLGVLIGFTTENYRVVGLAIRDAIKPELMSDLDPLTKSMIANRQPILENEVSKALVAETSPQKVLAVIASSNPWSFHVTHPESLKRDGDVSDMTSIERIAQDYVFMVYRHRHNMVQSAGARRSNTHYLTFGQSVPHEYEADTALPWVVPRVWCSPNSVH